MIKISRKTKNGAIVTFNLDFPCENAFLKGEWNNWKELQMKKKKDGTFYIRVSIPNGKWQFGYLCDGKWKIDDNLPKTSSPFNSFNSILDIKD